MRSHASFSNIFSNQHSPTRIRSFILWVFTSLSVRSFFCTFGLVTHPPNQCLRTSRNSCATATEQLCHVCSRQETLSLTTYRILYRRYPLSRCSTVRLFWKN